MKTYQLISILYFITFIGPLKAEPNYFKGKFETAQEMGDQMLSRVAVPLYFEHGIDSSRISEQVRNSTKIFSKMLYEGIPCYEDLPGAVRNKINSRSTEMVEVTSTLLYLDPNCSQENLDPLFTGFRLISDFIGELDQAERGNFDYFLDFVRNFENLNIQDNMHLEDKKETQIGLKLVANALFGLGDKEEMFRKLSHEAYAEIVIWMNMLLFDINKMKR